MGRTSIEWADFTVNPIRARDRETGKLGHWCEKVSPGCANCYSSAWQRFRGTGHPFEVPFRDNVEVYLESRALDEVLRRRIPTRWFWCDMTDMFGEWISDEWLATIFGVMQSTPDHTHLVLTKRPERMQAFITQYTAPGGQLGPWPWSHVHLGVSVENQATRWRLDVLRQISAAIRFASLEPLLEDLGDLDLSNIDQAIFGGESGAKARPCDLAWIRRGMARARAAGCAVFVKQLGAFPYEHNGDVPMLYRETSPVHYFPDYDGSGVCFSPSLIRDRKGGKMSEWPRDLRVREYPA